jgi:hypothetical protein
MLCNLPTNLLSESFPTLAKKTLWLAGRPLAKQFPSLGCSTHAFRKFGPLELVGSEKRRNSDVQQKFTSFCLLGWEFAVR